TLTVTYPTEGVNEKLTRFVVGMHDYDTGLDMDSFRVTASFEVEGLSAGKDLAALFRPLSQGVWELKLSKPLTELPRGTVRVAVKDRQGNLSRAERTFSVETDRKP